MMLGWIIGLWDEYLPASLTRQVERKQPPLFFLRGTEPVFEVWFWHIELGRWFVMSKTFDIALKAQGVVYFDTQADLESAVLALGGKLRKKPAA